MVSKNCFKVRHGVIMDNTYRIIQEVKSPTEQYAFNMHELKVLPGTSERGLTALHIMNRMALQDVRSLGIKGLDKGYVGDTGFREVELVTGKTVFEWWPAEHISLDESLGGKEGIQGPAPRSWNWLYVVVKSMFVVLRADEVS
jgi:hypothetical protein